MASSANEPLPGAPDPWAASQMPPFRSRPPYLMTEMIATEPALAQRVVARLAKDAALARLAEMVTEAARRGRPILTTGCGTSEHAAMAIAALVNEALDLPAGREATSVQALEGLRRPLGEGLLIGVSHEGGTMITNQALRAARDAGAATALITVSDRSPGAELADVVVTTEEMDRSWCHTVGYLSPVLAGVVLAAKLTGSRVDGRAVRALLDVTEDARGAAALAAGLTGTDRLIVAGSGPDLVSARELALKVSEGARLPAQALDVETILHGHLAAATRWTGLVLVAADAGAGDLVRTRIERLLSASATLAMPVAGILAEPLARDFASELTPAGRLVVPRMGRVKGVASTLLGAVIPFQLLAERLARARGVNPDTLGREDEAQVAAHA